MYKSKDVVVVIKPTAELTIGTVLMVKDKLGFDGQDYWYVLTNGARDYLIHGGHVNMSVPYPEDDVV